jgi:hypothetical protein
MEPDDAADTARQHAHINAIAVFVGALTGFLREKGVIAVDELESLYEAADQLLPDAFKAEGERALVAIRMSERAVLGITRG